MLKWDQHCHSLFAVKTPTRCVNSREFQDPHNPYNFNYCHSSSGESSATAWKSSINDMLFWGICYHPPPPPPSCFFMHPSSLLVMQTQTRLPLGHDVIYGWPCGPNMCDVERYRSAGSGMFGNFGGSAILAVTRPLTVNRVEYLRVVGIYSDG